MITRHRLAEIRKLAEGLRIAVVGDLMLDEFLAGTVERISPEAPVPVRTFQTNRFVLGGAGNAARTLAALGAKSALVPPSAPPQPSWCPTTTRARCRRRWLAS